MDAVNQGSVDGLGLLQVKQMQEEELEPLTSVNSTKI